MTVAQGIWDRLDIDSECMPRSAAAVIEGAFASLEREARTEFARGFAEARRMALEICRSPNSYAGCTSMVYTEKTAAECAYDIGHMVAPQDAALGSAPAEASNK